MDSVSRDASWVVNICGFNVDNAASYIFWALSLVFDQFSITRSFEDVFILLRAPSLRSLRTQWSTHWQSRVEDSRWSRLRSRVPTRIESDGPLLESINELTFVNLPFGKISILSFEFIFSWIRRTESHDLTLINIPRLWENIHWSMFYEPPHTDRFWLCSVLMNNKSCDLDSKRHPEKLFRWILPLSWTFNLIVVKTNFPVSEVVCDYRQVVPFGCNRWVPQKQHSLISGRGHL
jgi:hypothetical protein